MTARRADESGVILLNVLVVVAIASAALVMMVASQDLDIQRSVRLQEAARAAAVARGGELSARVALRRDALTAPEVDHLSEPWAAVADTDVPIEGGRFSLSIEDAQARFDVNALIRGGAAAEATFERLVQALRLPPDTTARVAGYVRLVGPASDLSALSVVGLSDDDLARLSEVADATPIGASVNLNTAVEPLVAALIGNPVAARILVDRRSRSGFLTGQDLQDVGVPPPPGTGFTSSLFRVRTEVTIGDTTRVTTSLLHRRASGDTVEVVALSRRRSAGAPSARPRSSR
jgi:general secretion pathway protein K